MDDLTLCELVSTSNMKPLFCTHKIPEFSRILYKIPSIILFFFKCGLHIQLGKCLHFFFNLFVNANNFTSFSYDTDKSSVT